MEKRHSKRVDYSIKTAITAGRRSYPGFIENLSGEGFFVITSNARLVKEFYPGGKIDIKFNPPTGKLPVHECEIKWIHIDKEPAVGLIYSMGMEIQALSSDYSDFYSTLV